LKNGETKKGYGHVVDNSVSSLIKIMSLFETTISENLIEKFFQYFPFQTDMEERDAVFPFLFNLMKNKKNYFEKYGNKKNN